MRSGSKLAGNDYIDEWVVHRHFEEIESTQTYVEQEYASFDPSKLTAVSAGFQSNGRGTRDRRWEASHGKSVLVSFFFRFPVECSTAFVNRNVANTTKVLALAAANTLSWAEGSADIQVGIKWPNDLIVSGGKVGGILARAIPSSGGRLDGVIIGVGININTPSEDLCSIERPVWPATSLRAASGGAQDYDIASIRQHLINAFAVELRSFFQEGFPAFRERINSLEVLMGSEIRFKCSETEVVDGTFEGVDDDGLIVLRLRDGETKSYPSGEIVPRPELPMP